MIVRKESKTNVKNVRTVKNFWKISKNEEIVEKEVKIVKM